MKEEPFVYQYTAQQQKQIREIREKYLPKPVECSPVEQLCRLDASVTKKGAFVSLLTGVLSCLILGSGMSCVLVWGDRLFWVGILAGILGIIGIACAYPLYTHITKKERERLAPEILRLADTLLK